jgi:hypothetical protein
MPASDKRWRNPTEHDPAAPTGLVEIANASTSAKGYPFSELDLRERGDRNKATSHRSKIEVTQQSRDHPSISKPALLVRLTYWCSAASARVSPRSGRPAAIASCNTLLGGEVSRRRTVLA